MSLWITIQTANRDHICQSEKCQFGRKITKGDRYLKISLMARGGYSYGRSKVPDAVVKRHAFCPLTKLECKNPTRQGDHLWPPWRKPPGVLEQQLQLKVR